MSEQLSNVVYLLIVAVTLTMACWKALALRRDPTPTLALTTSMFLCASMVYAMAAPAGYRIVGEVTGQPSFATLPVYLGILICFSLVHIITLLWDPRLRQKASSLRRTVTAWSAAYITAAALMVLFFTLADLSGPADPLRFNTAFSQDPMVLLFLTVFLATLSSGTLNTFRQCRQLRLDDHKLQHSLRAFGLAMLGVFGYVVCGAPAIAFSALGDHTLDTVGVFGSTCGVVGTIIMCYGLSGGAIAAWLRERRDFKALQPLWELVVAGVDQDLAFSVESSRNHHLPANVTFNLHRKVIEILDGIRALRPWVSPGPAEAVYRLHQERLVAQPDATAPMSEQELQAAATAAALRHAANRLQRFKRERGPGDHQGRLQPPAGRPAPLPGENTPAADERDRLLLVAKALAQPLVAAALREFEEDRRDNELTSAPPPQTSPSIAPQPAADATVVRQDSAPDQLTHRAG
ncbi:MAB_1171c family putative transporter [Streptomyces sp. NPDC056304]|uniref:MAB_1171c family putative transporter n=1 Tax=Streptomyces sp. NPDC056304 TaxID=3345778 RepID=UPI0035D9A4DB